MAKENVKKVRMIEFQWMMGGERNSDQFSHWMEEKERYKEKVNVLDVSVYYSKNDNKQRVETMFVMYETD